MANNLEQHETNVADAIRTKKGTTAKINPQNFASEILSIPTGGKVYEIDIPKFTLDNNDYFSLIELNNYDYCLFIFYIRPNDTGLLELFEDGSYIESISINESGSTFILLIFKDSGEHVYIFAGDPNYGSSLIHGTFDMRWSGISSGNLEGYGTAYGWDK